MSSMFMPAWTEAGQCYTFKGPEEEPFITRETGWVTQDHNDVTMQQSQSVKRLIISREWLKLD